MITNGIAIYWDKATEFITFDRNSLNEETEVSKTIEYWNSTRNFVAYSTTSHIQRTSDGHVLKIDYKHDLNNSIPRDDACWGHSVIHIPFGATSGKAEWFDDNHPEDYDGATTWKEIKSDLRKLPAKEVISRLKRNQATLRKALIAIGASCAITDETTIAALEAAHIIPSAKLGAEVIENALLLRADLHKLFDKHLFSISKTGEVINISKDLSKSYIELLSGKRITKESIDRVRMAIETTLDLKQLA
jgi:hypothetical protein